MRGYFGVGVEGISKPFNVGSIFRSSNAFGASFMFTIGHNYEKRTVSQSDTSKTMSHLPFYEFPDVGSMLLPKGCALVGVELIDDAIDLPSFRHPKTAAYILGPEKGSLSPEILKKCDYTIKIPTSFCLNVGMAAVIVMYDRLISMGNFPQRPVREGGFDQNGMAKWRCQTPYDELNTFDEEIKK
ncbi:MAG: RNA methyltransferase [Alphaproteobacteria bacterium]